MLRELQYRRVAIILAAFVLGALLMSTGLPAQGVAPEVSILSPEDGLATNQDTLPVEVARSGPRNLDSGLSEISIVFQAAVPKLVASK